jgi:hypothetical protein
MVKNNLNQITMEINPIYCRYQNQTMSFETTLRLLQELISERLNSDYRKIRREASNAGRVNLCFTAFFTRDRYNEIGGFRYGYQILNQEVRNFRNFRPDGELGHEVAQIENLIETLRNGCLSGVIL